MGQNRWREHLDGDEETKKDNENSVKLLKELKAKHEEEEFIPFEVKLNTTEGINQALYGLLDGVEKVRDVAEYPGVVEYKCTVNEDNLIAIFTKWVGRERIYYNEFTVYAKTYIPSGSFEDSDFVE